MTQAQRVRFTAQDGLDRLYWRLETSSGSSVTEDWGYSSIRAAANMRTADSLMVIERRSGTVTKQAVAHPVHRERVPIWYRQWSAGIGERPRLDRIVFGWAGDDALAYHASLQTVLMVGPDLVEVRPALDFEIDRETIEQLIRDWR